MFLLDFPPPYIYTYVWNEIHNVCTEGMIYEETYTDSSTVHNLFFHADGIKRTDCLYNKR